MTRSFLPTPGGGFGGVLGIAYIDPQFDLTGNPAFSASFGFSITTISGGGADGMAFVIQSDPEGLDAASGAATPSAFTLSVQHPP